MKSREELIKERKEIKKYANHIMYSDVNPFEVVEVKTSNKVMVRRVNATLIESVKCVGVFRFSSVFDNSTQRYEYASEPTATPFAIRWSKAKKNWFSVDGSKFSMSAEPIKFYDYNF